MMNKLFIIWMISTYSLLAQDFSPQWDYVQNQEEQVIDEDLFELWQYYYQRPINLNDTIDILDLRRLELLSENEFRLIADYCKRNKLQSIYQLQSLEVNIESLRRIKDFIYTNDKTDILARKYKQKSSLFQSIQIPLKPIRDTEYQGSLMKYHLRYRQSIFKNWAAGINWEKDVGEPIYYNHQGFNNLKFSIQYKSKKALKKVVIGKYDISIGQGLTLNTTYNYHNPYFIIPKKKQTITSSLSSKETNYLQGIALIYQMRNYQLNLFYSRKKMAGRIDEDSNQITSIDRTGLHRTAKEIEKRHRILEQVVGMGISRNFKLIDLNWNAILFHYSPYYFKSKQSNIYQSLNYQKRIKNLFFQGEISFSNTKSQAHFHSLLLSLGKKSDLSLHYRYRRSNFFNDYTSTYSNYSNTYEEGYYWAFQHQFNEDIRIRFANDDYQSSQFESKEPHYPSGNTFYTEIRRDKSGAKSKLRLRHKKDTSDSNGKFKLYAFHQFTASELIKMGYTLNYSLVEQENSSFQQYYEWRSKENKNSLRFSWTSYQSTEGIYWKAPYFYGIYSNRFIYGRGQMASLSLQTKINRTWKYGVQVLYLHTEGKPANYSLSVYLIIRDL